jgi:hypothetical protein
MKGAIWVMWKWRCKFSIVGLGEEGGNEGTRSHICIHKNE